jgi:hypothetical protein
MEPSRDYEAMSWNDATMQWPMNHILYFQCRKYEAFNFLVLRGPYIVTSARTTGDDIEVQQGEKLILPRY